MTTTLNNFIASIVIDIIVLIWLEQVVSRHLIAADEKSLQKEKKQEIHL